MYDLWTEVMTIAATAIKGLQRPVESLSNHMYRWALLLRNHTDGRRASR